MLSQIDHLVIASPNLDAGAKYVQDRLGVSLQAGGTHPSMATHNLLLRLGDSVYLEVIAPDPGAPTPQRPRWFELDKQTPHSTPQLVTWVARTSNIRAARNTAPKLFGNIEAMTRGELSWQITIPANGSLAMAGAVPALINWQDSIHPAGTLDDNGCRLRRLVIHHPDTKQLQNLFGDIGLSGPIALHRLEKGRRPFLEAVIETPSGIRTL